MVVETDIMLKIEVVLIIISGPEFNDDLLLLKCSTDRRLEPCEPPADSDT